MTTFSISLKTVRKLGKKNYFCSNFGDATIEKSICNIQLRRYSRSRSTISHIIHHQMLHHKLLSKDKTSSTKKISRHPGHEIYDSGNKITSNGTLVIPEPYCNFIHVIPTSTVTCEHSNLRIASTKFNKIHK